jgi:hypothetical protein
MTTVLISQCLEGDSADLAGPHDRLPSLLHVGYGEAARLYGPEPVGGMGRLAGSGPTGRGSASHRLGVRQDLALCGRLAAEVEVGRSCAVRAHTPR